MTPEAREDKIAQAALIVAKAAADRKFAAFDEANPGLRAFLEGAAEWSDFAGSLLSQLMRTRRLSPRQIAAATGMMQKCAARAEPAATVDLSQIKGMFDKAVESGLKAPTYRAHGLVISRAGDRSRNPGALYVKADGRYLGKVVSGAYHGDASAAEALKTIAADPQGEAVRYGRETGVCACCGRTLTAPESVARGIGPVCANLWFGA